MTLDEILDSLVEKQRLFVHAYFATEYNSTEAAKLAGYGGNNLNRVGHELKNKPKIKEAIRLMAQKRIDQISVTEEYVLKKLIRTVEAAESEGNHGSVLRGLELAARHLGMLRDRTEITGKDGSAIKYEEIQNDAAEFARSISRIASRDGKREDSLRLVSGSTSKP